MVIWHKNGNLGLAMFNHQFHKKSKSTMRKVFLTTCIFLVIAAAAQAQSKSYHGSSYTNALGVKVWDGAGISFKHFFNQNAGELIGYFYRDGVRITGLYEIHGDISGVDGLKWYIGPGAHVGFYGSKYGDGAFVGID